MGASRSRLRTSSTSAGLRLTAMKLASMRPLALQKAASRALVRAEQGNVLGELALQELHRVVTFDADQA